MQLVTYSREFNFVYSFPSPWVLIQEFVEYIDDLRIMSYYFKDLWKTSFLIAKFVVNLRTFPKHVRAFSKSRYEFLQKLCVLEIIYFVSFGSVRYISLTFYFFFTSSYCFQSYFCPVFCLAVLLIAAMVLHFRFHTDVTSADAFKTQFLF